MIVPASESLVKICGLLPGRRKDYGQAGKGHFSLVGRWFLWFTQQRQRAIIRVDLGSAEAV